MSTLSRLILFSSIIVLAACIAVAVIPDSSDADELPTGVTISDTATYTYDSSTGLISITASTGAVSITLSDGAEVKVAISSDVSVTITTDSTSSCTSFSLLGSNAEVTVDGVQYSNTSSSPFEMVPDGDCMVLTNSDSGVASILCSQYHLFKVKGTKYDHLLDIKSGESGLSFSFSTSVVSGDSIASSMDLTLTDREGAETAIQITIPDDASAIYEFADNDSTGQVTVNYSGYSDPCVTISKDASVELVNSNFELKSGEATFTTCAVAGGFEFDFTRAVLSFKDSVLNIDTSAGDIEIIYIMSEDSSQEFTVEDNTNVTYAGTTVKVTNVYDGDKIRITTEMTGSVDRFAFSMPESSSIRLPNQNDTSLSALEDTVLSFSSGSMYFESGYYECDYGSAIDFTVRGTEGDQIYDMESEGNFYQVSLSGEVVTLYVGEVILASGQSVVFDGVTYLNPTTSSIDIMVYQDSDDLEFEATNGLSFNAGGTVYSFSLSDTADVYFTSGILCLASDDDISVTLSNSGKVRVVNSTVYHEYELPASVLQLSSSVVTLTLSEYVQIGVYDTSLEEDYRMKVTYGVGAYSGESFTIADLLSNESLQLTAGTAEFNATLGSSTVSTVTVGSITVTGLTDVVLQYTESGAKILHGSATFKTCFLVGEFSFSVDSEAVVSYLDDKLSISGSYVTATCSAANQTLQMELGESSGITYAGYKFGSFYGTNTTQLSTDSASVMKITFTLDEDSRFQNESGTSTGFMSHADGTVISFSDGKLYFESGSYECDFGASYSFYVGSTLYSMTGEGNFYIVSLDGSVVTLATGQIKLAQNQSVLISGKTFTNLSASDLKVKVDQDDNSLAYISTVSGDTQYSVAGVTYSVTYSGDNAGVYPYRNVGGTVYLSLSDYSEGSSDSISFKVSGGSSNFMFCDTYYSGTVSFTAGLAAGSTASVGSGTFTLSLTSDMVLSGSVSETESEYQFAGHSTSGVADAYRVAVDSDDWSVSFAGYAAVTADSIVLHDAGGNNFAFSGLESALLNTESAIVLESGTLTAPTGSDVSVGAFEITSVEESRYSYSGSTLTLSSGSISVSCSSDEDQQITVAMSGGSTLAYARRTISVASGDPVVSLILLSKVMESAQVPSITVALPSGRKLSIDSKEFTSADDSTSMTVAVSDLELTAGSLSIEPRVDLIVDGLTITNQSSSGTMTISYSKQVSLSSGQSVLFTSSDGSTKELDADYGATVSVSSDLSLTLVSGKVSVPTGGIMIGDVLFTTDSSAVIGVSSDVISLYSGTVKATSSEFVNFSLTSSSNTFSIYSNDVTITFGETDSTLMLASGSSVVYGSKTYAIPSGSSTGYTTVIIGASGATLSSGSISVGDGVTVGSFTSVGSMILSTSSDGFILEDGGVSLPATVSVIVDGLTVLNSGENAFTVTSGKQVTMGNGDNVTVSNEDDEKDFSAVSDTVIVFDSDLSFTVLSGTVDIEKDDTVIISGVTYTAVSNAELTVTSSTVTLVSGEVSATGPFEIIVGTNTVSCVSGTASVKSDSGTASVTLSTGSSIKVGGVTYVNSTSSATTAAAGMVFSSEGVELVSGGISVDKAATVKAGSCTVSLPASASMELSNFLEIASDSDVTVAVGTGSAVYSTDGGFTLSLDLSSGTAELTDGDVSVQDGVTVSSLTSVGSMALTLSGTDLVLTSGSALLPATKSVTVDGVTVTNTSASDSITVTSGRHVMLSSGDSVSFAASSTRTFSAGSSSEISFGTDCSLVLVSGTAILSKGDSITAGSVLYSAASDSASLTYLSGKTQLDSGSVTVGSGSTVTFVSGDNSFGCTVPAGSVLTVSASTFDITSNSDVTVASTIGTETLTVSYSAVDSGSYSLSIGKSSGSVDLTSGKVAVGDGVTVSSLTSVGSMTLSYGDPACTLVSGSISLPASASVVIGDVTVQNSGEGSVTVTSGMQVSLGSGDQISLSNSSDTKEFSSVSNTTIAFDSDLTVTVISGTVVIPKDESYTINGVVYTAVSDAEIEVTSTSVTLVSGEVSATGSFEVIVGTNTIACVSGSISIEADSGTASVTLSDGSSIKAADVTYTNSTSSAASSSARMVFSSDGVELVLGGITVDKAATVKAGSCSVALPASASMEISKSLVVTSDADVTVIVGTDSVVYSTEGGFILSLDSSSGSAELTDGDVSVQDGVTVSSLTSVGSMALSLSGTDFILTSGSALLPATKSLIVDGVTVTNTSASDSITVASDKHVTLKNGDSVKFTSGSGEKSYTATSDITIGFDEDLDIIVDSGTVKAAAGETMILGGVSYTMISESEFTVSDGAVTLTSGEVSATGAFVLTAGPVTVNNLAGSTAVKSDSGSTNVSMSADSQVKVGVVTYSVPSFGTSSTAPALSFTTDGVELLSGSLAVDSSATVKAGSCTLSVPANAVLDLSDSIAVSSGSNITVVNGTTSVTYSTDTSFTLVLDKDSGAADLSEGKVLVSDGVTIGSYVSDGSMTLSVSSTGYTLESGNAKVPASASLSVDGVMVSNSASSQAVKIGSDRHVTLGIGDSITVSASSATRTFNSVSETEIEFGTDLSITLVNGTVDLVSDEVMTVNGVEFTAAEASEITVSSGNTILVSGTVFATGAFTIVAGGITVDNQEGTTQISAGTGVAIVSMTSDSYLAIAGVSYYAADMSTVISGLPDSSVSAVISADSSGVTLTSGAVNASRGTVSATIDVAGASVTMTDDSVTLSADGASYTYINAGTSMLHLAFSEIDTAQLLSGYVLVPAGAACIWNSYTLSVTKGSVGVSADDLVTVGEAGARMVISSGTDYNAISSGKSSNKYSDLVGWLAEYSARYAEVYQYVSDNLLEIDNQTYLDRLDAAVYDLSMNLQDNKEVVEDVLDDYDIEGRESCESRFESFKSLCISELASVHSAGESQAVSNLIEDNISSIRSTYYDESKNYSENLDRLVPYEYDSIAGDIERLQEESFETYRSEVLSEIDGLHTGETCTTEKGIVDAAYSAAQDIEYDSDITYDENRKVLGAILDKCESDLGAFRDESVSFSVYCQLKSKYIETQDTFGSEDVAKLVNSYKAKVLALNYSKSLSLDDNLLVVDGVVDEFDREVGKIGATVFESSKTKVLADIDGLKSKYPAEDLQSMTENAVFEVTNYYYDTSVSYDSNTVRLSDIYDSLVSELERLSKAKEDAFSAYCTAYLTQFGEKRTDAKYADEFYQGLFDDAAKDIEALAYDHTLTLALNESKADDIASELQKDIYDHSGEAVLAAYESFKAEAVSYINGKVVSGSTDEIDALVDEYKAKVKAVEYDASKTNEENEAAVTSIVGEFDEKVAVLAQQVEFDSAIDFAVDALEEAYGSYSGLETKLADDVAALRSMQYDSSKTMDENIAAVEAAANACSGELFELRQSLVKGELENYRSYLLWKVESSVSDGYSDEAKALEKEYRQKIKDLEFDSTSYLYNKNLIDDIYDEYVEKSTPVLFRDYREALVKEISALSDGSSAVDEAIGRITAKVNAYVPTGDLETDEDALADLVFTRDISLGYAKASSDEASLKSFAESRIAAIQEYDATTDELKALVSATAESLRSVLSSGKGLKEMALELESIDVGFDNEYTFILYRDQVSSDTYLEHILEDSSATSAVIDEYKAKIDALRYSDYGTLAEAVQAVDALYDEFGTVLKQHRLLDNSTVSGLLNADGTSSVTGGEAEYPDGSEEIWGIVANTSGMGNNSIVKFTRAEVSGDIYSARQTAAEGSLISVLSDGKVLGAIDVTIYNGSKKVSAFSGEYTVKILLPKDMRGYETMQVAYTDEFGDVQVYDAHREGNYLVFETKHFSVFYLVGVNPVSEEHYDVYLLVAVVAIAAVLMIYGIRIIEYRDGERKVRAFSFGCPEGSIPDVFGEDGRVLMGWTVGDGGEMVAAGSEYSALGKFRRVKLTAVWKDGREGGKQ